MVRLSVAERRALRPPDRVTVSEWAERTITIPAGASSRPGPLSIKWTSYFREPLDSLGNPMVESITLMCCTQVGKTMALLIGDLYFMAQDPSPTLMVMPRDEDAEGMCQRRMKPLIEASPALMELMTGKKADYRKLEIATDSMVAYFAGANSPAGLASRPIRCLFLDEVDKYPNIGAGREADAVSLARERTKTFQSTRKIFMASTPTTREGLIYREHAAGDKRVYWVACPICKHYQELVMAQLKWPSQEDGKHTTPEEHAAAVSRDHLAHYECKHCVYHLTEKHKGQMIENGVWCPEGATVSDAGKVVGNHGLPNRSYQLSTLYSRWVTWSEVAAEFISSHGDLEKLRNFRNSWEGMPWEDRVKATSMTQVAELVTDYNEGEVNEKVCCLTAGVDVQEDLLYYQIDGWAPGMKESWRIKCGRVEEWSILADILFHTKYGEHSVSMCCVDSGYDTQAVYDFCRANAARCRPIKGWATQRGAPISAPSYIETTRSGKKARTGQKLWHLDTSYFKDRLTEFLQMPSDLGSYWIYNGIPDDYLRQIVAEHKVKDRKGKETWELVSSGRANHFLDCSCYSIAAAHMRGVYAITSMPQLKPKSQEAPPDLDTMPPGRQRPGRRPYGGGGRNGRRRAW